jgi:Glycosyltransferases, probably involved in cell wall biogenesis
MDSVKLLKVSIITVVFNGEQTIEQTILSVINQTYKNIEYIIIDGKSVDKTITIIKKYEDQISYWISEPDSGIYDAMNKGIKIATGDIIGIINADDWYEIDAIEKNVDFFRNNTNYDALCGDILVYLQMKSGLFRKRNASNIDCETLNREMTIGHPSLFVRKTFYEKYGMFDSKIKITADYDLVLRAVLKGANICYMPNIIANFRLGGSSGDIWKTNSDLIKVRMKNKIRGDIQIRAFISDVVKFLYEIVYNNLSDKRKLALKKNRGWEKI